MKPSSELFELIKSLSKSEKRFFKLSSSLQTGEKNYLKIFDAIDRQDEFDEQSIKDQFKKERFIKHFPSEKNHLYKLILKSLRAYHSDNSVSSLLKQEIKNIEILFNKALFKECNKFLMRAKKTAILHEKFYYLFELISWEKKLLEEALENGQFTKDLDSLILEEQQVIEKLRNLAAYHVLYSKINYVFRSGGFVRDDENRKLVQEIANHPLIKGKNTALSSRAATICYYTQGFCQLAKGDHQEALKKFERVKFILDEKPHIRKDLAKRYVRTLNNIISCQLQNNDFVSVKNTMNEMRSLSSEQGFKSIDVQVAIFKDTHVCELELYRRTGEIEKGILLVDDILVGLEKFDGKLHKEQELVFFYQIAYMYFSAGEFNKSLFWLNKVLNDNENTLRQDVYSYARLFNLVIHYELGNYDLLEYITKSTQRYLTKRQRDFKLEKMVIDYVKKLIKVNNVIDQKDIFYKFQEDISIYASDPEDQIVLTYFDFVGWVDSKVGANNLTKAG